MNHPSRGYFWFWVTFCLISATLIIFLGDPSDIRTAAIALSFPMAAAVIGLVADHLERRETAAHTRRADEAWWNLEKENATSVWYTILCEDMIEFIRSTDYERSKA